MKRVHSRETAARDSCSEAKKEKQGLRHGVPTKGTAEAWWGQAGPHRQIQDSPAPGVRRQSAPALSSSPSQQWAGPTGPAGAARVRRGGRERRRRSAQTPAPVDRGGGAPAKHLVLPASDILHL